MPGTTPSVAPLRVSLSEDPRDFQGRDWTDLVRRDPSGTIFHTPDFLKLYWEEFGEGRLLLAFGEDPDGRQIAAAAFELIGDRLRFLGGTEVTDYLGPVGEPAAIDPFATGLWEPLIEHGGWREADLRGLPEDSPWLAALREAAQTSTLRVEEADDQNGGVAPFVELPTTWAAYLEGLPSKLRHEIRRKAKKLEADAGPFEIETATEANLLSFLDRFVELHRDSEGPKGVFMVPGMEIFFRRLGEELCPRGIFRLTFVRIGGELAAGTVGFIYEGTYSLYNSAFDRRWQRLAPGMVLVAEDIRQAIAEGCRRFDLLKGDYAYKYRFGARRRGVRRLLVTRD
jgi:CelD/BcsL family acetyltransferase involved in cellulose biosynthesis